MYFLRAVAPLDRATTTTDAPPWPPADSLRSLQLSRFQPESDFEKVPTHSSTHGPVALSSTRSKSNENPHAIAGKAANAVHFDEELREHAIRRARLRRAAGT